MADEKRNAEEVRVTSWRLEVPVCLHAEVKERQKISEGKKQQQKTRAFHVVWARSARHSPHLDSMIETCQSWALKHGWCFCAWECVEDEERWVQILKPGPDMTDFSTIQGTTPRIDRFDHVLAFDVIQTWAERNTTPPQSTLSITTSPYRLWCFHVADIANCVWQFIDYSDESALLCEEHHLERLRIRLVERTQSGAFFLGPTNANTESERRCLVELAREKRTRALAQIFDRIEVVAAYQVQLTVLVPTTSSDEMQQHETTFEVLGRQSGVRLKKPLVSMEGYKAVSLQWNHFDAKEEKLPHFGLSVVGSEGFDKPIQTCISWRWENDTQQVQWRSFATPEFLGPTQGVSSFHEFCNALRYPAREVWHLLEAPLRQAEDGTEKDITKRENEKEGDKAKNEKSVVQHGNMAVWTKKQLAIAKAFRHATLENAVELFFIFSGFYAFNLCYDRGSSLPEIGLFCEGTYDDLSLHFPTNRN